MPYISKTFFSIFMKTFISSSFVTYNSGKQTWHIELMASLEANNDIILLQNLFDIIDMNITDLPGAIGTILGQEKLLKITLIRGRGKA